MKQYKYPLVTTFLIVSLVSVYQNCARISQKQFPEDGSTPVVGSVQKLNCDALEELQDYELYNDEGGGNSYTIDGEYFHQDYIQSIVFKEENSPEVYRHVTNLKNYGLGGGDGGPPDLFVRGEANRQGETSLELVGSYHYIRDVWNYYHNIINPYFIDEGEGAIIPFIEQSYDATIFGSGTSGNPCPANDCKFALMFCSAGKIEFSLLLDDRVLAENYFGSDE